MRAAAWVAACAALAGCGGEAVVDGSSTSGTGATSAATGGGSTSTTTTSTSASATGGGGSGGASGNIMVLEPSTLEFFELPTGAPRYAIGGQDVASDTCVVVHWLVADPFQQTCAEPSMIGWPEGVTITPMSTAPCTDWTSPATMPDDASGCFQLQNTMPLSGAVDVAIEVADPLFSGIIVIDNEP